MRTRYKSSSEIVCLNPVVLSTDRSEPSMRRQDTPHAMSWMSHCIHHAQRESTHTLTEEKFSLKGARSMHSFALHHHSSEGEASATETRGLILDRGWRDDCMACSFEPFSF